VLQKTQYREEGKGREGEVVDVHSSPSSHPPHLNHTLSLPYSGGDSLCTPRIGDSKYRCPWNMSKLWGLNFVTRLFRVSQDLTRELVRGFRWDRFVLSEWTTLIFFKWLLKLIPSF
jgi:hypothetical protein